jgi:hypothetical protein
MLQTATVSVQVVFDDDQVALTSLAAQLKAAARSAGAHDANARLGGQQAAACVICGADMTVSGDEVAVHLDGDGNLDHDLDADHVALAPSDCYA